MALSFSNFDFLQFTRRIQQVCEPTPLKIEMFGNFDFLQFTRRIQQVCEPTPLTEESMSFHTEIKEST